MEVERLVRLARNGDRAALSSLCEHFHPDLYRFFLRLNAPPADADDLSQNTLLRMMEKLETYRPFPGKRFEGWLFRIAYRLFIDSRRAPVFAELTDDLALADASPPAEDRLIDAESAQMVRQAVARLDDELRAMISMRYELDMPYRDIARALNIPSSRVKWRLHDALEKLRASLEKGGYAP